VTSALPRPDPTGQDDAARWEAMAPQDGAPLPSLATLLTLEDDGEDHFLAPCPAQGPPRLFGGLVAAQTLRAACATVPTERQPHSLHAYFIRPGRPGIPLEIAVERSRDGRSFTTRRAAAVQDGKEIFALMASFQVHEPGETWQPDEQLDVPGPDELGPVASLLGRFPGTASYDIRPIRREGGMATLHPCWVRLRTPLPDDPHLHACAIACVSDMGVVGSALPPGSSYQPFAGASLDHGLWFHRQVRADEWLLFSVHPAAAAGGRGLAQGTMHTQAGELVATVTQEALLRGSRLPPEGR